MYDLHSHLFLFKKRRERMPSSLQLHRINTSTATSTATLAGNYRKQQSQSQPTWITPVSVSVPDYVMHYHTHVVGPNQCCSAVVQAVSAPTDIVWSLVRRFDNPQAYKHFLKSCHVIDGDGNVGSLREVRVVSGLPAASSTERLEILDDEKHVLSFSVVGGDHRLNNYRSVTTLHTADDDENMTMVVESYEVDVPQGNTKEETCVFVDTIVRCNLQSLAQIAENLAKRKNHEDPELKIHRLVDFEDCKVGSWNCYNVVV
ncbi:abscisic acid receptor PYL4-like [Nicotiana sylvestris]|uniref:Abscisic acid receptor PYL4-like n=1 Tax=Nicotiana sylvestris TaxID=4096 RepID=A0A1U7UXU3_NICSY|nr:PREDICTED: abscisic acid receptor PYL4-like [Nicotiana sylvestris]